ncbi:MAG: NAD(P)/FAD-dependent oxidoreductase [Deltaproteobacteria bacterium]|nr:NAD(P)/FAD-dependent oxidoreductase [Deltaproteobacteria bacterium]
MKYLIIGCGPAALSAAAALRKVDPEGIVTILSRQDIKPYARMALPYLLAGEVEEKDLLLPSPPGTEILLGEEAIRIDTDRREIATAAGRTYPYDRLLIASGGTPERPKIGGGGDLPFVFTVRDLPDVTGIRDRIRRGTGHAVIAGAGPVGLEIGDALHRLGMSITFIVSSKRLFSAMLDLPAAELVRRKLADKGVEIRTGDDIARIERDGEVHLKSGERRKSDVVVFGKGVRPSLSFLEGSGIAVDRGVLVDDRLETNCPGVYAAGDAAQAFDVVYGDKRVNALWPAAVEQGRVAAMNMGGFKAFYPGSLSRNVLRVFGISILAAGRCREEGPDVRRSETPDSYRKIVLDRGILKGLISIGEVRNEGLYLGMIKSGADVATYADSLLRGSYGYGRYLARSMKIKP